MRRWGGKTWEFRYAFSLFRHLMPLSFSGPSVYAAAYTVPSIPAPRRLSDFSQPEPPLRSVGLPRRSQSQQSTIPSLPYSFTKLDARRTHSQQSSFDFSPRPAESGRDASVSPPTSTESSEAFTPNSPHAEERTVRLLFESCRTELMQFLPSSLQTQSYLGLEYPHQKEYHPTAQQHSLMNRAIEGIRPFSNFQPAYQPISRPVDYESPYSAMPYHSQQQIFPDRTSYPNFEHRYNFQYQPPGPLTTELYPSTSRHTLPSALIPLLHSPAPKPPQPIPGTQSAEIEQDNPPKKRKLSGSAPPKPRRVSTQTFVSLLPQFGLQLRNPNSDVISSLVLFPSSRQACPHPDCGAVFSRNYNMQSHLKAHQGIRDCENLRFRCSRDVLLISRFPHLLVDCLYCVKKFSRRHDRARHIASVHNIPIASQAITSTGLSPPQDNLRQLNDPSPPHVML